MSTGGCPDEPGTASFNSYTGPNSLLLLLSLLLLMIIIVVAGFCFSWDRVSLCVSGCPGICFVYQAGLGFTEICLLLLEKKIFLQYKKSKTRNIPCSGRTICIWYLVNLSFPVSKHTLGCSQRGQCYPHPCTGTATTSHFPISSTFLPRAFECQPTQYCMLGFRPPLTVFGHWALSSFSLCEIVVEWIMSASLDMFPMFSSGWVLVCAVSESSSAARQVIL